MKVSNGEENEQQPRTVVIYVKMDPDSRELLSWALINVARAGDHVGTLHVIPSSSEVPDPNGRCSSLLSLVKAFDSVLAVYDGFCNLKQDLHPKRPMEAKQVFSFSVMTTRSAYLWDSDSCVSSPVITHRPLKECE